MGKKEGDGREIKEVQKKRERRKSMTVRVEKKRGKEESREKKRINVTVRISGKKERKGRK